MPKIPVFVVDAFAQRPFEGNSAAICPIEDWLDDDLMQSIAAENNLSETAFIVAKNDAYEIRWFTPKIEVDLCGHATLAAAHVLARHLGYGETTMRFDSRSGRLFVSVTGDLLILDLPARPPQRCDLPPRLGEALGARPFEVLKARDYFAVFESEEEVRNLLPDFGLLSELECLGTIVTARGSKCDFVSRFFAPRAGINEDPVTGSAYCTLIPYWADKLKQSRLYSHQISRRGGELLCQNVGESVKVGGHAVTFMRGMIEI
jgi:predicted PhzF superfamily epimerase YddE/YHI9